jgi:MtN3 and saliva related transmembrane protein
MSGVEIEIFGFVAACLVNGATLPQVMKTVKTKLVRGISLPYWIVLFTGSFLWAVYGILTHGIPLISSSVVACSLCLTMIAFILRYR